MGYFYFRTQVLNKAAHSAVASAAYRSGEKLYSERDGLTKEYGERSVKPETYILAPDHAPDWVYDRQKLWNEVENVERQKNSQIVREIQVALPKELSSNQQKDMLLEFCKSNFSDEGMVADIAIHRDKINNPHAHIMLTMRPFNSDGSWGNKRQKVLQDVNGVQKKVSVHLTNWNDKQTMIQWRENYAELINSKFKENGIENSVSHKSYKEQGLDILPTVRLTRESYQIEKSAMKQAEINNVPYVPVTFYGSVNQEIREINSELKTLKELKKQHVISLDDYKQEKSYEEQLSAARSGRKLNAKEKEAMDAVVKRAKGFVDYQVAKDIVSDLQAGNWKKKIDNDLTKILAQKNLLNKAHAAFKEDPKLVIKYGFNPTMFKEQLKEKIGVIKELESSHNQVLHNYSSMLEKANTVLQLQSEFVSREFDVLYPTDQSFTLDQKYAALNEFKTNNRIVPLEKIAEIKPVNNVHSINAVNDLSKQSADLSKSIFILSRAVKKQTSERMEHLKNRDLDKAYEASLKIEQYSLQIEKTEKELARNIKLIKENIERHYNTSIPHNMNNEMLIKLHQNIGNGNASSDLENDAAAIYKETDNRIKNTNYEPTPSHQLQNQYDQNLANGLLQALEQIQRANEQKRENEFNNNKQRKRNRGNSLDR